MENADARKLISISLCKMARTESSPSTLRRRESSLHKHLLISTVLTKARNLYLGGWGCSEEDESSHHTDLRADESWDEFDFPLDEEDDDDLEQIIQEPLKDSVPSKDNDGKDSGSQEELREGKKDKEESAKDNCSTTEDSRESHSVLARPSPCSSESSSTSSSRRRRRSICDSDNEKDSFKCKRLRFSSEDIKFSQLQTHDNEETDADEDTNDDDDSGVEADSTTDQRVPSPPSARNDPDQDFDNDCHMMDVEQITNLVEVISFSKFTTKTNNNNINLPQHKCQPPSKLDESSFASSCFKHAKANILKGLKDSHSEQEEDDEHLQHQSARDFQLGVQSNSGAVAVMV